MTFAASWKIAHPDPSNLDQLDASSLLLMVSMRGPAEEDVTAPHCFVRARHATTPNSPTTSNANVAGSGTRCTPPAYVSSRSSARRRRG